MAHLTGSGTSPRTLLESPAPSPLARVKPAEGVGRSRPRAAVQPGARIRAPVRGAGAGPPGCIFGSRGRPRASPGPCGGRGGGTRAGGVRGRGARAAGGGRASARGRGLARPGAGRRMGAGGPRGRRAAEKWVAKSVSGGEVGAWSEAGRRGVPGCVPSPHWGAPIWGPPGAPPLNVLKF